MDIPGWIIDLGFYIEDSWLIIIVNNGLFTKNNNKLAIENNIFTALITSFVINY